MTDFDEENEGQEEEGRLGALKRGLDGLLNADPSTIRGAVSDMVPREAAAKLAQGTERTKKEVVRIIAQEVKGFLEEVDVQSILANVLKDHEMEVHIRFRPKDGLPLDEGEEADAVQPEETGSDEK